MTLHNFKKMNGLNDFSLFQGNENKETNDEKADDQQRTLKV